MRIFKNIQGAVHWDFFYLSFEFKYGTNKTADSWENLNLVKKGQCCLRVNVKVNTE